MVAAAGRTRICALGVERRAARGAGLLLLAPGVYVVTHSARLLPTGNRPESHPGRQEIAEISGLSDPGSERLGGERASPSGQHDYS